MTHPLADVDLLERTLSAVEALLAGASRDASLPGAAPSSPAQATLRICLHSAAALLDVSRSLARPADGRSPEDLEREWRTLIVLTKEASRSAYRGALVMADQRNLLAAQAPRVESEAPVVQEVGATWR